MERQGEKETERQEETGRQRETETGRQREMGRGRDSQRRRDWVRGQRASQNAGRPQPLLLRQARLGLAPTSRKDLAF